MQDFSHQQYGIYFLPTWKGFSGAQLSVVMSNLKFVGVFVGLHKFTQQVQASYSYIYILLYSYIYIIYVYIYNYLFLGGPAKTRGTKWVNNRLICMKGTRFFKPSLSTFTVLRQTQ